MRTLLLLALLLGAQEPADVDRLIKTLGSDSASARDQAQDQLVALGEKALPALRKALEAGDPETRQRAKAAIDDVERLEAEKIHDLQERETLRGESNWARDKDRKETVWQFAWTDGAAFRFGTTPWKGGLVLSTHFSNYLSKSYEDGLRDLQFEIVGVSDKDGKPLTVDRCGQCSPYDVYAKGTVGPIRPHLKGTQLWFSPYVLEFVAPKDGDRKKVGDLAVEVAWPTIKVTARRPMFKKILDRVCTSFSYEVNPGVSRPSRLFDSMGVRAGGGGGRNGGAGKGDDWCHCKGGPQPLAENLTPELSTELIVKKGGRLPPLSDVAKIKVWFQKPIEESFDLTPEIVSK
jgi:hypothetical protein